MGLFDYQWFSRLPKEYKLQTNEISRTQIDELEAIRKKWSIPHDQFALVVGGSPAMTKIVLEREIAGLRKKYPNILPRQMFALVICRRAMITSPEFQRKLLVAQKSTDLHTRYIEEWQRKEQNAIKDAIGNSEIENIDDINDSVFFLLSKEGYFENYIDSYGINNNINAILNCAIPKDKKYIYPNNNPDSINKEQSLHMESKESTLDPMSLAQDVLDSVMKGLSPTTMKTIRVERWKDREFSGYCISNRYTKAVFYAEPGTGKIVVYIEHPDLFDKNRPHKSISPYVADPFSVALQIRSIFSAGDSLLSQVK